MATFAAHTLLESGTAFAIAKIAGSDYPITWAVIFAIHAVTPDVLKQFFNQSHEQLISEGAEPFFFPHLTIDRIFHQYKSWWSKLWWLEILMWLVGISGYIYAIFS